MNHYSRCCKLTKNKRKDVCEMNLEDEFDEDVYIDAINMSKTEIKDDQCFTTLNVNNKQIQFKIGT